MIRVMIVDDYEPTVRNIVTFINQTEGYSVLTCLTDGQEMIHFFRNNKKLPDLVLLDINMWKMDGVTAMDYLHDFFPDIKVIAFSAYMENKLVADMFSGGAYAFVWKINFSSFLLEALKKIEKNLPYVDPRIGFDISLREQLIMERKKENYELYSQYKLTNREIEIIKLIASDMDYNEIYSILHITPRTIETHIKNINYKLHIKGGKAGLLLHALRNRLTKIASLPIRHEKK
ncbi:response regulator protein VraR [mine drainage metagenome]|uniref:Response regulator protein VraR n=1 Tax=mine drainage metagenome TaxID=410659 RepID=A0A1J5SMQ4_9ZZZZ